MLEVLILFLLSAMGLISLLPSRTDTERAAVVFAAWNGTRRSATMSGPGRFEDRSLILKADGADHRCHERTARVNVRASARTNGERGRHLLTLGHLSKPTNPSACGTQAKGCFRGPGSVQRPSLNGPNHRSCAVNFQTVCGLLGWLPGGSRKRPFANAFRTAPLGETRNRNSGLPCGRSEHGAMKRVRL